MLKQLEDHRVKSKVSLFGQRISIRTFLIIPFAILLATMIAVVTLLSFQKSNDALDVIKTQIRDRTNFEIEKSIKEYMNTAHVLNKATRTYINKGRLDINDPKALQDFFWNYLSVHKHVNYIYFGYKDGAIILIARRSDGSFVVRQTDDISPGNFKAGTSQVHELDDAGNRARKIRDMPAFDSRNRPWFKGAYDKKGPIWTHIYPFFLERALGITAALPLYDQKGEFLGVIATDILLSTFNKFLQKLKSGQKGEIFIIEKDGALVASTADQKPFFQIDTELHRIGASESRSPIIRKAYRYLEDNPDANRFDVQVKGEQHLVELFPFKSELGIDWRIGITVSEKEILGPVRNALLIIIYFGLGALIFSIILCYILGQKLAYPLLNLKAVATSLAHHNIQARAKPSGIMEINTLASTFNFMADQIQRHLNTLKKRNKELKTEIEQKQSAQRRIRYLKEEIDIKQRTKLAGELHDGIGQSLQAINLGLRMIQQGHKENSENKNMVPDLIKEVDVAITQLRTIIEQQRPMFLDQVDILTAIESYGMKFAKRSGFRFILRTSIEKLELASFIKEPLFLIFQESLNNTAKYAQAKHVNVSILVTQDHVFKMKISDDGIGFEPSHLNTDKPGGLGLSLMAERAESVDGKLSVQSTPDVGTMIFVEIPLEIAMDE